MMHGTILVVSVSLTRLVSFSPRSVSMPLLSLMVGVSLPSFVSFSLHNVSMGMSMFVGMCMSMSISVSFISFHMGVVVNVLSMVVMFSTMFMSSISMIVSLSSLVRQRCSQGQSYKAEN